MAYTLVLIKQLQDQDVLYTKMWRTYLYAVPVQGET
jgi:hypothetical protein